MTPAFDPYSAALLAGASIAAPAPAGPSQAGGGSVGGAAFDNSGWQVSFGDNSGLAATRTETGQFSQYLPYVVIAAVVIVASKWLKR